MENPEPWVGAVELRPGLLAFSGALGPAHTHAHAALQLLLVASGAVTLTDQRGRSLPVKAALIPAGVRHTMNTHGALGASVYLDSAGRAARTLMAALDACVADRTDVAAWTKAARPALSALTGAASGLEAAEQAVAALAGLDRAAGPASPPQGEALHRALALVPELVGGPIRLTEVAVAVGLSPSRLRHLFSEQLGLPFTAHVRRIRLQAAMETVRRGGTLTDAAHAAGFTDSAHLTRVFHAMFGLTPSAAARHVT